MKIFKVALILIVIGLIIFFAVKRSGRTQSPTETEGTPSTGTNIKGSTGPDYTPRPTPTPADDYDGVPRLE